MRGVNKVILVGNLGKDPEVQYLDSNVGVAKFPLATSESYKDKEGNRVEQTEWHNIVAWRGLADVAEKYLKKGNRIYLEGKIKTRSWDDKETGAKKYMTEIVADNFIMLDRKEDSNYSESSEAKASSKESAKVSEGGETSSEEYADDLPF